MCAAARGSKWLEREERARQFHERQLEERRKKVEEQRMKEERRHAAVEEKRRQRLEEEKVVEKHSITLCHHCEYIKRMFFIIVKEILKANPYIL